MSRPESPALVAPLTAEQLSSIKKGPVRKYYAEQSDTLETRLELDSYIRRFSSRPNSPTEAITDVQSRLSVAQTNSLDVLWAIRLSFLANICLFAAKLFAAIISGSFVVLAATVDSGLDILSGSIIFLTSRIMRNRNRYKYPVGKARYENLGIIVFASVMGTAALQVLLTSIQKLIDGPGEKIDTYTMYQVLGILAGVVVTKSVLFVLCYRVRDRSPSCEALSQDHRNDIITNSYSLLCLVVGIFTDAWWLDPLGAAMFSIFIVVNWARTGYYHLTLLAGKAPSPRRISEITYFASNFDPAILQIDTVRLYHVGLNQFCEVDIVLPADLTLRVAHDIGEALQNALEQLPGIERAFVHLDYDSDHRIEHPAP